MRQARPEALRFGSNDRPPGQVPGQPDNASIQKERSNEQPDVGPPGFSRRSWFPMSSSIPGARARRSSNRSRLRTLQNLPNLKNSVTHINKRQEQPDLGGNAEVGNQKNRSRSTFTIPLQLVKPRLPSPRKETIFGPAHLKKTRQPDRKGRGPARRQRLASRCALGVRFTKSVDGQGNFGSPDDFG